MQIIIKYRCAATHIAIVLITLLVMQVQAEEKFTWHSLYLRDHALAGKIYSTAQKTWITHTELSAQIKANQFILLGEKHTNLDHHVGQAKLIESWLQESKPTALALEMLAYEDKVMVDSKSLEVSEFTEQLDELSPAWKWELYQPLLQTIIKYQLPILGANLSRKQLDRFSKGGECELLRNEYALDVCSALSQQQQNTTKQLIYDAHCEYLPIEHTQPMMHMQVAKDVSFALAMIEMARSHQVALIAGAIHVRKDIGVPVHLRALGYDTYASIAFINVQKDKFNIQDYLAEDAISTEYDYVIFTPSDTNRDPCEEFAQQLKNMSHPSN